MIGQIKDQLYILKFETSDKGIKRDGWLKYRADGNFHAQAIFVCKVQVQVIFEQNALFLEFLMLNTQ